LVIHPNNFEAFQLLHMEFKRLVLWNLVVQSQLLIIKIFASYKTTTSMLISEGNVYVWQIWRLMPNLECNVRFSKTKVNVNRHLHFLLQLLSQRHTHNSTCHFNFWSVNWRVIFFFTNHTTCQNLDCAQQLTCSLFSCKFLHAKCRKLAKTLSKYTQRLKVLMSVLAWSRVPLIPKHSRNWAGRGLEKWSTTILLNEQSEDASSSSLF
jgi:hypothetical protein